MQEVRHIRGAGDINWNEVTLSMRFYSNSFHHQILFLNALVDKSADFLGYSPPSCFSLSLSLFLFFCLFVCLASLL